MLFEVQPDLNPFKMSKMHPVVITARDGLSLPAYLSLPVLPGVPGVLPASVVGEVPTVKNSMFASSNSSSAAVSSSDRSIQWAPKPASAAAAALAAAGGAKPLNLNLPMVLYVHGGPWSRDYWGADSVVQWMNNRGYAVLQVNFRGSSGAHSASWLRTYITSPFRKVGYICQSTCVTVVNQLFVIVSLCCASSLEGSRLPLPKHAFPEEDYSALHCTLPNNVKPAVCCCCRVWQGIHECGQQGVGRWLHAA
jgi:hypothetical protein